MEWFVIVNPNAGKRKGEKDWLEIAALLTDAGIRFVNVFTEHRDHAVILTRKYVENGYRNIIVVGGDGTLNEVVNGIFTQAHVPTDKITLAMIPVGTGNDWCRMFNIPGDYKQAIKLITKRKIFIQDTGTIKYIANEGIEKTRYFINMAGMGFDAMVAKKTNMQKDMGKGNPMSYVVNILSSLFLYTSTKVTIMLDNEKIASDIFSMSVGICQYNGGGMKQAPGALPDDGLFDMTLIKPIGKFKIIRNIVKLFDGSFTRLPEVSTFRSSKIIIHSEPPMYMEADGESLGHTPFVFNILPQSLYVVSGLE
ncbi:MAG: diacylglycerol kinase family protein [Lentimicrobiaceae bacterium]|jgi:YegS/Rv2252/BmrU family lipid kinase